MNNRSYGKKTFGNSTKSRPLTTELSVSTIILIFVSISAIYGFSIGLNREHYHYHDYSIKPSSNIANGSGNKIKGVSGSIISLNDLSIEELHPKARSDRYIVSPPSDEKPVSLVNCETTAGQLHIVVHPSWAPLGAERFIDMVQNKYFSSKVALMRCIRGFICQFGIAGNPEYNKPYKQSLRDDKNWLPEGPTNRRSEHGVKRFNKGYLAYAGGGKNSRTNQFIIALKDNERLGGGSPWEVPWGEVVGKESFSTLDRIYTGYGENGPPQGRLSREGSSDKIRKEFPQLDYILGCTLMDTK